MATVCSALRFGAEVAIGVLMTGVPMTGVRTTVVLTAGVLTIGVEGVEAMVSDCELSMRVVLFPMG